MDVAIGMALEIPEGTSEMTLHQDSEAESVAGSSGCPADVNGDGIVSVLDLLCVLSAWGAFGCPEDINGDGIVDVQDLLELLASWGPCP